MQYLDFELEIKPGAGREYPVAVTRSPAGEARATMRFPFDRLALETRLDKLQIALLRSGGVHRAFRTDEETVVQSFGEALFDALFDGEVRSRFDVSYERALAAGQGLRIKLRILDPELAALPWEFLYDPRGGEYLCLSRSTPLLRYLELPHRVESLQVAAPLRVLGLVASPRDQEALDVGREQERLERGLADLRTRGLVELRWLRGQTWRELQAEMQAGPWHVLHFVGHGGFDSSAGEGFVCLADERGLTRCLRASELGRLLADHHSLRLVLLNACEGGRASAGDVFSSTASVLVRRGIPAVVAMQYVITDRAAVEFSRAFYDALARSMPVDAAVSEARKAVSLDVPNTLEWGTPVLYMRATDGVLFDVSGQAAPVAAPKPVEMPPPMGEPKPVAPPVVETKPITPPVVEPKPAEQPTAEPQPPRSFISASSADREHPPFEARLLTPRLRPGERGKVSIVNRSEQPRKITMTCPVPQGGPVLWRVPTDIEALPGEMVETDFTARPQRRPLIGRSRALPFTIHIYGSVPAMLRGEVIVTPRVRWWMLLLVMLALVALILLPRLGTPRFKVWSVSPPQPAAGKPVTVGWKFTNTTRVQIFVDNEALLGFWPGEGQYTFQKGFTKPQQVITLLATGPFGATKEEFTVTLAPQTSSATASPLPTATAKPFVGSIGMSAATASTTDGALKIALLAPLTGAVPAFGASMRDAAQLAVDGWNAQGGVLGKRIELVVADSQCEATPALNAARKLIAEDGIQYIVGEVCSRASLPVSDLANQRGVVMITPSSTNPAVTVNADGSTKAFVFRACFVDARQGRAAAAFAFNTLGARTAATWFDAEEDYAKGLATAFDEEFSALGGRLIGGAQLTDGDTDFSTALRMTAAARPDIIFAPVYYDVANLITAQAGKLGLPLRFMGGDGWDSSALDLTTADGAYFTTHFSAADPRVEAQSFAIAFGRRRADPTMRVPDAQAALAYDAVNLLLTAIETAGADDPLRVRDALAAANYNGVTGNITFDAQHNAVKPVTVVKVEDDGIKFVSMIQP